VLRLSRIISASEREADFKGPRKDSEIGSPGNGLAIRRPV
jgi:hypothetical protein